MKNKISPSSLSQNMIREIDRSDNQIILSYCFQFVFLFGNLQQRQTIPFLIDSTILDNQIPSEWSFFFLQWRKRLTTLTKHSPIIAKIHGCWWVIPWKTAARLWMIETYSLRPISMNTFVVWMIIFKQPNMREQ